MTLKRSQTSQTKSKEFSIFCCSNALIAFARSLCKCLLAVLITAREASRIKLPVLVVPKPYDVVPLMQEASTPKTKHKKTTTQKTKQNQKSSQALKTFFQLLQIKRLQLKLTNTLQKSYPIQSQHQVPRTCVKQQPKTPQTTKTNENPSPSSSMHKLVPFGSKLVPTWFL